MKYSVKMKLKEKISDSVFTLVDPSIRQTKEHQNIDIGAPETISQGPDSGYSVYFQACFDIGYFFFIIPFRLKNDGSISTNKFQRILCGVAYVLTIYRYIFEVRKFPFVQLKRNVVNYFLFFQKVASLVFHTALIKILWFDMDKFRRLHLFLYEFGRPPTNNRWLASKVLPLTICALYILIGVGTFVFGTRIVEGLSYQNPEWFYRRNVAEARYAFFITNKVNSSTAPEMKDIYTADHFGAAIMLFKSYCRNVIGFYWDSVIFMACLTLWLPVTVFTEEVKSQIEVLRGSDQNPNSQNGPDTHTNAIMEILRKYNQLKKMANLINYTLQYAVMTYMMETVVYYSIYIDAIFVAPDWFRQFRVATAICGVLTMMPIASDICQKIGIMREWLGEDEVQKTIPVIKATILLDELSTNPVSISGGVFTITYSLLGMIGTTLVTYFIICSTIESNE